MVVGNEHRGRGLAVDWPAPLGKMTRILRCARQVRTQKEPPDNVRVETLISDLGDSVTWLETDALTAYRQVLLDEDCRDLTTLWTPIGRLRSTRLCFGLTNAGTALGARLTEKAPKVAARLFRSGFPFAVLMPSDLVNWIR